MGFSSRISESAAASLDKMADVLVRPREAVIAVAEQTGWHPTSSSAAQTDLALELFPKQVNLWLLNLPRVQATVFLRFGADHLAGFAALLRQREVWAAPGALGRASLEHGVRAFWVLDPKVAVRERCARATLEELVSAHFSKQAVKHLGGKDTDAYRLCEARWIDRLQKAQMGFSEVELKDDPFKWMIEGHAYPRITDVVELWGARRSDAIPGRGIYDALSLYPHPQGLAGREELTIDPQEPTGTALVTDISHIARQATAALAGWYDGFVVLTSYHGFEPSLLGDLEREARLLFELGVRAEDKSQRPAARRRPPADP